MSEWEEVEVIHEVIILYEVVAYNLPMVVFTIGSNKFQAIIHFYIL